jgi:putative effector of murein hydrolase LrgA (UPF0299 family)
MIHSLLGILLCQLAGETFARFTELPIPGPVVGMVLMLALLAASPWFCEQIRPVAQSILSHLSLLFVPAGVGVVGHLTTLGTQTVAVFIAVVVSTALAIAAGAVTFSAVARLTGSTDE